MSNFFVDVQTGRRMQVGQSTRVPIGASNITKESTGIQLGKHSSRDLHRHAEVGKGIGRSLDDSV